MADARRLERAPQPEEIQLQRIESLQQQHINTSCLLHIIILENAVVDFVLMGYWVAKQESWAVMATLFNISTLLAFLFQHYSEVISIHRMGGLTHEEQQEIEEQTYEKRNRIR